MIPMAKRLLSFRWQGKTYQFNCLPFGLSGSLPANNNYSQVTGPEDNHIHRRHPSHGENTNHGKGTHGSIDNTF